MVGGWGLIGSPVAGTRERIEGMIRRFGELTDEVGRLEGLVEDQRRDLEIQNSSRMGGMYDDEDGAVTQSMVDEEEEQVRALEEKIKAMQVKVRHPFPEFAQSLTLRQIANLDARMATM
jgi:polyhydroxyalkanoate synthesis regulator phasin